LKAYLYKETVLAYLNISCVEISPILFCIFSVIFEIQQTSQNIN